MKKDISSLTGLRFFAAFLVMYAHSVAWFPTDSLSESWRLASAGMTLFFVLSGFVIHYNYHDTIINGGWWNFLAARIARLYPLYLLFLLWFIVQHPEIGSVTFWNVIPFYLTLTQNWLPLREGNNFLHAVYLGGAWSISAEMLLYLIYIPLVRLILKMPPVIALAAWIIGVSIVYAVLWSLGPDYWSRESYYWVLYYCPFARLSEFLLGTLIAHAVVNRAALPYKKIGAAGIVITILGIGAAQSHSRLVEVMQWSWGYAPAFGAVILYLASRESALSRLLGCSVLVALGNASYSLYFFHGYMFPLFPTSSSSSIEFAIKMGVLWMIACLISMGLYTVYEAPARKWLRQKLSRRTKFATAI